MGNPATVGTDVVELSPAFRSLSLEHEIPMSASRRSRPAPLKSLRLVITALGLLSAGCEVDRSFFHMDSNSPSPFFGFDLVPRRRSSAALTPPPGPSEFQLAGGVDLGDSAPTVRVK